MKVVSPQCRDDAAETGSAEAAFSLQMSAVVEDFAMAYGQRESMSRALMREKERAGQFANVLSSVLEDNVAGTLRTACNVLSQKRHEIFRGGAPAADAQMQRFILRELLAVEGLAYMARLRATGFAVEYCELLPVIKQVLARLQPVLERGGRDLGISECRPGVRVAGAAEGVRHILLNLFIEILCQDSRARVHAIAMRCNEAIAELTVGPPGGDGSRAWEWNLNSPGVRIATGLARDMGILLTLSSSQDADSRLEFAILNDS